MSDDIRRVLDNWCYENADCNLIAWIAADHRDPQLASDFIDFLGEVVSTQDPKPCSPPQDFYPDMYHLVREALVREIRDAARWQSIREAVEALNHVRHIGEQIRGEIEKMGPYAAKASGQGAGDGTT